jgi:hypothetical protein
MFLPFDEGEARRASLVEGATLAPVIAIKPIGTAEEDLKAILG